MPTPGQERDQQTGEQAPSNGGLDGLGPFFPPVAALELTPSLWRDRPFLQLWAGQSVSLFGSQLTLLALPLVGVLTLHASASQMGWLRALGLAPSLLFGLLVGLWVDHRRRRPMMVTAALAEAILLAGIPAAALWAVLTLPLLFVVAFGVGFFSMVFDIAAQAYLPSLVGRERVLEANSRLQLSQSSAQVVGPGLAGVLVQAVTAPLAVVANVTAFVIAAAALALIGVREPPQPPRHRGQGWAEIKEGLATLLGDPVLRPIAITTSASNLFFSAQQALYVLFAVRELHLTAAEIGLVLSAAAPGAVVGSLVARRIARTFGVGPTLLGAMWSGSAMFLALPLAPGRPLVAIPFLAAAGFLLAFSIVVYNTNQISLRQAIVPDHLLGRVTASVRFLVWGTLPIGALLGGLLGTALGLRPTLLLVALGALLAATLLWPVHGVRDIPKTRAAAARR